jgi:hypothetical protein
LSDFRTADSQSLQDPKSHVFDIRRALPHVFVLQALIGLGDVLVRPLPSRGSIFMVVFNGALGGLNKRGIFEDERLRPKNLGLFFSKRSLERLLVSRELDSGFLDGLPEFLALSSRILDFAGREVGVDCTSEEKFTDGDTSRYRNRSPALRDCTVR